MKRSIGYCVLVLLLTVPSCKTKYGELDLLDDYLDPTKDVEMELFTNPTDPAIVKITDEDGTKLTYYGEKDIDGNPLKIKSLSAQYPDDTKPYLLTYGETGENKPTRIVCPNGSVFEFFLYDELNMRVKVIWPDGEYRISVPVDIDTIGKSPVSYPPGRIENIRESIKPAAVVTYTEPVEPVALKNTTGQMTFLIKQCGSLVNNATVTITTNPLLGQSGMPADHIGDGTYAVSVPRDDQAEAKIEKECTELVNKIKTICNAYTIAALFSTNDQGICDKLQIAISAAFPNMNQSTKEKVIANCPKAVKLVPLLCQLNDKKDLLSSCQLAKLTNEIPMNVPYTYTLTVTVPGFGTETSVPVAFDPDVSVGWEWDMGGKFAITDLSTVPSDPGAVQGYTATAMIVCPMPSGTPVTISVTGSDGYSNSNSATMKQSGTISLYVPGGKQGVQDIITVEAVIDGITYTDKISIVF